MPLVKLLTVCVALSLTIYCPAQSKSSKSSTADLQKSIKELGDLFKKKKNSGSVNTNAGIPSTPQQTTDKSKIATTTSSGAGTAGNVLPGAKTLDVDVMYPFDNGAAVVAKGSSFALINAKGETIIPFNTYGSLGSNVAINQYSMLLNGLIRYRTLDQREWGYLNAEGKILARGVSIGLTENKRLLQINNNNGTTSYGTTDGKIYTHPGTLDEINEGIGIVRKTVDNGNRAVFWYKKLTGEAITSAIFDEAYSFSDGMALVGKKDNYGLMKYGYINSSGKLAIPFSYSVKPSNFMSGFAKVEPKDKSAFEYAFINKRGEVVFQQTLADINKYGVFDRFTNYGLAINFKSVMDTTFKIRSKKDFFASFGITQDAWFNQEANYMENEKNPKLFFSIRGLNSKSTSYPLYGFINLEQKKVVMPAFDLYNQSFIYFDPVSHLAYAKTPLGRDEKNVPLFREGYINEDGLFVFVKGAGSKW